MKPTHFLVRFALPTTILLFLWVTMRTHSAYVSEIAFNSESMVAFGFPFSWHAASTATSMGTEIGMLPLVFDFVVYFLMVIALLGALNVVGPRQSAAFLRRTSAALWVAGLLSLAGSTLQIAPNASVRSMAVDVYFDDRAVRTRSLALGLQPLRE